MGNDPITRSPLLQKADLEMIASEMLDLRLRMLLTAWDGQSPIRQMERDRSVNDMLSTLAKAMPNEN